MKKNGLFLGQIEEKSSLKDLNFLGRTDLRVPVLCLGTMTFGLQTNERDSFEILDRAFDGGLEFVDTATDEEFERCRQERQHLLMSSEFTDYEGGYLDGKIVNLQFLRDVADHGSEPARSAFTGAILVYSRIPEVEQLIHFYRRKHFGKD